MRRAAQSKSRRSFTTSCIDMEFSHTSVLLEESINALNIKPGGVYVDATAGGGGHSARMLESIGNGRLVLVDRDPDAIEFLRNRFGSDERVTIVHGNYAHIKAMLAAQDIS